MASKFFFCTALKKETPPPAPKVEAEAYTGGGLTAEQAKVLENVSTKVYKIKKFLLVKKIGLLLSENIRP